MHRTLKLLALFLLAAGAAAAETEFPSIVNFLRVDKTICTGGQPALADLERLKATGVKAIINLRRPAEMGSEGEEARAKKLHLRYINIPVDSGDPKDAQVEEFLKVMSRPENRPAFIHCATANRVGAFWMIRRVLVDGWPMEKAEEEAVKVGMHSPVMREFARGYIERHAKK